jgi:hypothetical protein
MSAEGDVDREQAAVTEPYEPLPRRWLRNTGSWVKRTLAPAGATKRRWWWERLFVPVPGPVHYLASEDEIVAELTPAAGRSEEVLAEAQTLFDEPFERSDGIERRATTLQGAVAIAASFALAGGALLLDTGKVPSHGWRVALVIPYAITIVSLLACGLRALRATSRVLVWHYPHPEGVLRRAALPDAEARIGRAAELLHSAGRNQATVRYKVAQMRAAAHWFALALAALLVTAALFCAYVLTGNDSPPKSASWQHLRADAAGTRVPARTSGTERSDGFALGITRPSARR